MFAIEIKPTEKNLPHAAQIRLAGVEGESEGGSKGARAGTGGHTLPLGALIMAILFF